MNLYISTVCLKNGKDVRRVLDVYGKAGINNVELGSLHQYMGDGTEEIIRYKQNYNMNFIVHHYFPPPKNSVVINLASQNLAILKKSLRQIKNSIKFCNDLGIKLFSFHAGFRMDPNREFRPDGGFQFDKDKPLASYDKAFETFVRLVEEINDYAIKKGVKLAVENNVVSKYNLLNGENKFLLGCDYKDFDRLFKEVPSHNLGLLLDLGHLKVTSHWLNFNKYEFIERLKDKVFLIHLHDNDGKNDQHKKVKRNSWWREILHRKCFQDVPTVLEAIDLDIEEILECQELVKKG